MIKAANVVKFFDDTRALDHFCTTIEDGSIYGLIGSNGSGKSTFLRLIAGVYRPDEGQVEIEDARMASDVTEMLMGTDVPPRRAFIYSHAQDAELDV